MLWFTANGEDYSDSGEDCHNSVWWFLALTQLCCLGKSGCFTVAVDLANIVIHCTVEGSHSIRKWNSPSFYPTMSGNFSDCLRHQKYISRIFSLLLLPYTSSLPSPFICDWQMYVNKTVCFPQFFFYFYSCRSNTKLYYSHSEDDTSFFTENQENSSLFPHIPAFSDILRL